MNSLRRERDFCSQRQLASVLHEVVSRDIQPCNLENRHVCVSWLTTRSRVTPGPIKLSLYLPKPSSFSSCSPQKNIVKIIGDLDLLQSHDFYLRAAAFLDPPRTSSNNHSRTSSALDTPGYLTRYVFSPHLLRSSVRFKSLGRSASDPRPVSPPECRGRQRALLAAHCRSGSTPIGTLRHP